MVVHVFLNLEVFGSILSCSYFLFFSLHFLASSLFLIFVLIFPAYIILLFSPIFGLEKNWPIFLPNFGLSEINCLM